MELANEDATMEMEHRTTYLATVGTLGPMIGLVGTVYGMIMAFRVIAMEGSSPQASQLAAGISTALSPRSRESPSRSRRSSSTPCFATGSPGFARSGDGGRAASRAVRAGSSPESPASARASNQVPASSPSAHPHPFALSATLAATGLMPTPGLPADRLS